MEKKNSLPAKEQEKAKNATAQDKNPSVSQETKSQPLTKTLEQTKAEFDRLNRLFYRQRCFDNAVKKINDFAESLEADSPTELETKNFRLVLASGYNNEDVKVTNRDVIADTLNYLRARIENTIEEIQTEILKG
jgi:hypothetical protein